jgi:hypothetical protein
VTTTLQLSLYAAVFDAAMRGNLDWPGDALTLTLHTAAYGPDVTAHTTVADLTDELTTGDGYTVGGTTLASATSTVVAASAWPVTRADATAYATGEVVRPAAANNRIYRCVTAGTTGTGAPTYPTTAGQTVTDGGVVWSCIGRAAVILGAADLTPAWAAFSAGPFRHVVLSDRTPALASSQPLIGVWTYASDQVGGGGAFNIDFGGSGVIVLPVP